jgi:hypothetical protein
MGNSNRILLKSVEELWHIFSHGWAGRDKGGNISGGLVTRCGINDLTLKVVGVQPLPKYATRCVGCFGHGA